MVTYHFYCFFSKQSLVENFQGKFWKNFIAKFNFWGITLSAVLPFEYYFLHEASQFVSLTLVIYSYTSANFNDIRFYSQWSSVVLLRTLWLISAQASQAKNTWCKGQFVYIENCMGKSPFMKKKCVINYLIWNKVFLPQMYGLLDSCADFKVIPTLFSEVIWNLYSSFYSFRRKSRGFK